MKLSIVVCVRIVTMDFAWSFACWMTILALLSAAVSGGWDVCCQKKRRKNFNTVAFPQLTHGIRFHDWRSLLATVNSTTSREDLL